MKTDNQDQNPNTMDIEFSPVVLEKLTKCQEVLGYTFRTVSLLVAALTHSSGASNRLSSNERLEFLGDAILGAVIVELLYHRCESMMEGEMTQLKSTLVSRRTCAMISKQLNMEQFLFLGKGMNRKKIPDSMLANVQESVIGAIYLDGGILSVQEYIHRVFEEEIIRTLQGEGEKNFKMMLQHRVQKCLHKTPTYRVLEQRGPDHRKSFRIQVVIGDTFFQSAWGPSKRIAEQHAAANALCLLDNLPPVYPSDD